MNSKGRGRRRFLKEGATLAGLVVGAMRTANGQSAGSETPPEGRWPSFFKDTRAYGERSRFETFSRWPIVPKVVTPETPLYTIFSPRTPLQDLKGIITPNPLHYYIEAAAPYPLPEIDPQQYRLVIHGMVDRPLILTLEEL